MNSTAWNLTKHGNLPISNAINYYIKWKLRINNNKAKIIVIILVIAQTHFFEDDEL